MKSFSCFKPRDPFRMWSKELDKRVAVWAKNFDSCFKLLLLGPAGAGKTTIMKQMKIIHFEGFSLEERQQKAKEIRTNLLESVRELTACITASGHQINWCDKENQSRLDFINGLNLDDQTYDLYAAKIYDYSKRILTDKGVEELFAQLNQLSITHRSQYLLNRVDEIRNVNYIPNNDDILQSRRRTSDIQKLEFQVNMPVNRSAASNQDTNSVYQPTLKQTFCMFDVGGQRGERRKWIQVFDGVSAVMFLIDSSSFDAVDDENGRNKLKETINLFQEVWTTRFLLNSNFVLLFNKQDILKEKIERGHQIEDYFPEYKLYKFQPNERHLSEKASSNSSSRSGEKKASLFRTISSGSTVAGHQNHHRAPSSSSSAAARNSPVRSSFAAGQLATAKQDSSDAQAATKQRKSGSLYRFGRSRSFFGGKSSSVKLPSSSQAAASQRQHYQQPLTNSPKTNLPDPSARTGTIGPQQDDPKAVGAASRTNSSEAQRLDQKSSSSNAKHEQDTHLAYIKARSFIRDKFLQITRQVDTHQQHGQRKFSSPNLPIYNQKVSASSAAAASGSRVDQPKRNVCYHYTTATDTENIRDLFENLQKMVIKSSAKEF